MTDLLPCPFCGGIARIAKGFNDGEIVYCENEDCHVSPELNGYHEPETAIEMWNSRVSTPNKPAALDAKIKRYEDALYYLIERADDSNDARYGTLSASFVRDVCSKALDGTG